MNINIYLKNSNHQCVASGVTVLWVYASLCVCVYSKSLMLSRFLTRKIFRYLIRMNDSAIAFGQKRTSPQPRKCRSEESTQPGGEELFDKTGSVWTATGRNGIGTTFVWCCRISTCLNSDSLGSATISSTSQLNNYNSTISVCPSVMGVELIVNRLFLESKSVCFTRRACFWQ